MMIEITLLPFLRPKQFYYYDVDVSLFSGMIVSGNIQHRQS